MARTSVLINVIAVRPNQPPQYTGPSQVVGTVGVPMQLQGVDGDGDPITWSMDTSEYATISAGGLLTPSKETPVDENGLPLPQAVTVHLDDGKP